MKDETEPLDWEDLDAADLGAYFADDADDGDWGDPDGEDPADTINAIGAIDMPRDIRHEMTNMAVRPDDPSELGYPPTLPIEIALQTAPMEDIREAYGFTKGQWQRLMDTEQFKSDITAARTMLSEEGMSFKAKARLQAEELLKTSWSLIHDRSGNVPPSVKADLLKFTIKAAGLEASPKEGVANITPLQINISL